MTRRPPASGGPQSFNQRLLALVKEQCWHLVGDRIQYRWGNAVSAGRTFADELRLPSPPRVEQLRIHVVDVDYDSLTWTPIGSTRTGCRAAT